MAELVEGAAARPKGKFWMVFQEGCTVLRKIYTKKEDAVDECNKLARDTEKEIYLLESMAKYHTERAPVEETVFK